MEMFFRKGNKTGTKIPEPRVMPKTKVCRNCYVEKSWVDFCQDKRNADLLQSYCKSCSVTKVMESKKRNWQHYRSYMREYKRRVRGYKGNGIKTYQDYLRDAGYIKLI